MNGVELRDKLLLILTELHVSTETFLKGELSFETTMAIQGALGPWHKIVDQYDRKRINRYGAWISVMYFKHHNVYLGAETWFDPCKGTLWDTAWIHEVSPETVEHYLAVL